MMPIRRDGICRLCNPGYEAHNHHAAGYLQRMMGLDACLLNASTRRHGKHGILQTTTTKVWRAGAGNCLHDHDTLDQKLENYRGVGVSHKQ